MRMAKSHRSLIQINQAANCATPVSIAGAIA
jgi:hypothetical protein